MRIVRDAKTSSTVLLFDGTLEALEVARAHNEKGGREIGSWMFVSGRDRIADLGINWPERTIKSWDDAIAAVSRPWKIASDAIAEVRRLVEESPDLVSPADVRRRGVWNDESGEVCVDRVLAGDPNFYREARRRRVRGPASVTLFCNNDIPWGCNWTGVFFRSMAAIAAADVLEANGYACELWLWMSGSRVYRPPFQNQFSAFRLKRSGEPLDETSVIDAMSAWYCLLGLYASLNCVPDEPMTNNIGYVSPLSPDDFPGLLDVESGTHKINVPMVTTAGFTPYTGAPQSFNDGIAYGASPEPGETLQEYQRRNGIKYAAEAAKWVLAEAARLTEGGE